MTRYALIIALVFLTCGCGPKMENKPLTAVEFTDAFVVRLNAADASLSIECRGELELRIEGSQGTQHSVFLDNAFQEHQQVPDELVEELRQRAVKNLGAILPEVERHGGDGTFMVTAGGTYDPSLLLVDSMWSRDTFDVQGEIVVGVPSRDLLLVTGSEDTDGLARLRKLAAETVEEASYHLTAQLFVRRDGKWLPLDE